MQFASLFLSKSEFDGMKLSVRVQNATEKFCRAVCIKLHASKLVPRLRSTTHAPDYY